MLPNMTTRYAKNAVAVFNIKFHLVWCPKYRRKVLTGETADRLMALLYEKAAELALNIEAVEVMPDHVHSFSFLGPHDGSC